MSCKKLVTLDAMGQFITSCAIKAGASDAHAKCLSDILVAADYRGHASHGLNRMHFYVNDLKNKRISGYDLPCIIKETPAVAWVNGNNVLGALVGMYSMNLAVKKAKVMGIGCVSVKGSNHYGIGGFYAEIAEKDGLIGMAMTNTNPCMTPTRGSGHHLGTNPISFAAPSSTPKDTFLMDIATTTVAMGKIELKKAAGEKIPANWAYDESGKPTTDASVAMRSRCLSPLGGGEETGGHKGYTLSAMVEVFCGVLAGANMMDEIRQFTGGNIPNLGQFFMAIDPNFLCPGFGDRLAKMNKKLRDVKPANPSRPVLVPGDFERMHMKKVDADGGIFYQEKQIDKLNEIAETLGAAKLKLCYSS